jgi:hypothetical protein
MSIFLNGFLRAPLGKEGRFFNQAGQLCIIASVFPNRAGIVEYVKPLRCYNLSYDSPDPFLASIYAHITQAQVEQLLGLMLDTPPHLHEGDIVHRADTPFTVLRAFPGNLVLLGAGTELVLVPAISFLPHGVDPEWRTTWAAVDADLRGLTTSGYYLTIPFIEVRVRLRKLRPCVNCFKVTKLQCPNRCGIKYCEPCWSAVGDAHFLACTPVLCAVCAVPCRRQCSGCHRVAYCSVECQKVQWSLHKLECTN